MDMASNDSDSDTLQETMDDEDETQWWYDKMQMIILVIIPKEDRDMVINKTRKNSKLKPLEKLN